MMEMHVGLLALLKEFDAICRKHDITYYLEGGSLLGAVRHKGFLPWDDDIDLSITRDNFQKLLSVIDQELPENRELYCYERFPNYLRDTVKYTNLDTTVLFRNHILDGNAAGQHIDLFILDPVPSDSAAQAEYKKYATIYSELLSPVYVLCDDIVDYLDEYAHYQQLMEEQGREPVLNLLREKLFTYEDSEDCDTYLLRWGNRHIFYPKALFGTPVELQFEDGHFPAPSQYYRFLRRQFGDSWMIIPEASQQEDHNTFDNYHVPCKTFIADYAPFIDYEQFRKENVIRKDYNLKLRKEKLALEKTDALYSFIAADTCLHPLICELSDQARELLEQERYPQLMEYFTPYYTQQLSAPLVKQNLALSADVSVIHSCALAMTMCGQFGQAEKLIRASGVTGDPALDNLMDMITDIRGCLLASEEGRYAEAEQLAEKWHGRFPLQLNLAVFKIQQAIRNNQDPAQLAVYAQTLLEHYPDCDELLFLMGVLSDKQNKHEDAIQWYRRCLNVTRNGLILMQMPELPPEEEPEESDPEEIME